MTADLERIRAKVQKVSDLVERQLNDAVQALFTGDRERAARVVLGDRQVNRRIRDIDHLCHAFIVRHAPSARHLRYASGVLRLDVALERVGDYAGSIGREVARLSTVPGGSVGRDIELIAQQARLMLSQALEAFHAGDEEASIRAAGMAEQTDLTLETVIDELIRAAEKGKGTPRDLFGLLRIVNLLKRVAEQAENVCEQTAFIITGREPDPRVYRVLFIDEHNDAASQIAEAYARKAYPESGRYASAGWTPTEQLSPELVAFMDSRGVDVRRSAPAGLSALGDSPEHYHVIVALSDSQGRLRDTPFRTTVVEWKLEADGTALDRLYEEIVPKVQDLMITLAGPDAR